jgi:TIGR03009 family protein
MRFSWLALAGLSLVSTLQAQQPPPAAPNAPAAQPSAAQPNTAQVDTLLQRWEQEMKRIETLSAELNRTTVDKVYQGTEVFSGVAKYMKPNLAVLEMKKKDKPDTYEKYMCSGTYLYEWVPGSKVIRAHELPPPKDGQVGDDNFLSFLFGMKSEEAKKRYELKVMKEDQYYYYVQVFPRMASDKADFQEARLALNKSTFLPREVRFTQPNGNEIIWDVPKIQTGVKLARDDFAPPQPLPQGWTIVRVPRGDAQPPRVIREQQGP